jgi:tripartite-type tricarboxylate transporter receptor subunit TctC
MKNTLKIAFTAALTAASVFAASAASAQGWPQRPVRILTGFAPGSGADTLARITADRLSDQMKASFVVENRPGAGGSIATTAVAKAPADGYTLLFGLITLAITPHMQRNPPYDPVADLAPVAKVAELNSVMVGPTNAPYKNLKELVAYAKANPGKIAYASSGKGSPSHLGSELIRQALNLDIRDVPYKDGGQAMTDVMSGQVGFFFAAISATIPHIRSGRVVGLAIGAPQRSDQLPEVPTVAEQIGIKGLEFTTWYGVLGPAGLPADIVERLNRELAAATQSPEMRDRVAKSGARVNYAPTREFAAEIRSNSERYGKMLRDLGLVE